MAAGGADHYVRWLLDTLGDDPARTVLHWREGAVSAAGLREAVLGAACALRRAGVGPGTTVAILTEPNIPSTLVARYGAHLLAATVTHIRSMNARTDGEHLPRAAQARILRATGARVLVVDSANAGRGAELASETAELRVIHVDELVRAGDDVPAFVPYAPGDSAVIDLTSGSTNAPKLVRQPFGTRDARIRCSGGDVVVDYRVTMLSVTPISHATATMVDAVLIGGGTVILHDGFTVDTFLRAVVEHRITDVYLAVPHLYQLIDHPGVAGADLSSLRVVLYSGTVAAPARIAGAVRLFGARLAQLYGSTEAGGICTLMPIDHTEPELLGSVGRPFSWVKLQIRQPDSDAEVARGEIGEVCVQSETLMAGYLGDPGQTAPVLCDGWLRTGDLARWDRYGYLHLEGRLGNIIKANGLKIYPSAVERALLSHSAVANAAVYAVGDRRHGEVAHAAVELRTGETCTVENLRAQITSSLSAAHVPSAFTFWSRLPLNGSGKPDYVSLRNENKNVRRSDEECADG